MLLLSCFIMRIVYSSWNRVVGANMGNKIWSQKVSSSYINISNNVRVVNEWNKFMIKKERGNSFTTFGINNAFSRQRILLSSINTQRRTFIGFPFRPKSCIICILGYIYFHRMARAFYNQWGLIQLQYCKYLLD